MRLNVKKEERQYKQEREGLWPGSRDIPSQFWSSQSSLSLYRPPGNRVLHISLQETYFGYL